MWMIRLELGRVQTDSTAAMFLFSFDWDTFISLSGILNMIRGKDASSNTVMVVKVIFLLRVKLMERSEGRGYRQADNGAPRGRVLSLILLLMMINCTIEEKPEVGWHDLKERQRLSQMCSFRLLEETTGASECCSLCADLSKHVNNIEPTDPQVMVFFMVTPSTCLPHLVLYRPHTCLCGLVLHELPAPLSPQTLGTSRPLRCLVPPLQVSSLPPDPCSAVSAASCWQVGLDRSRDLGPASCFCCFGKLHCPLSVVPMYPTLGDDPVPLALRFITGLHPPSDSDFFTAWIGLLVMGLSSFLMIPVVLSSFTTMSISLTASGFNVYWQKMVWTNSGHKSLQSFLNRATFASEIICFNASFPAGEKLFSCTFSSVVTGKSTDLFRSSCNFPSEVLEVNRPGFSPVGRWLILDMFCSSYPQLRIS